MKIDIYNQKGEKTGNIELPEKVFGLPWNSALVHQVMTAMLANKRANTAHAKTRSEVRGGGRKPWRQKGLGRARHGSIRSPIWKGGGVTFGPRNERNYSQKINQKMKKGALLTALSQKVRDNEVLILDKITLEKPKTKEAATIMKALSKIKNFGKIAGQRKNSIILLPNKEREIFRAFRNLAGTDISEARNINLLDVLNYKYLVFPKDSLNVLKL